MQKIPYQFNLEFQNAMLLIIEALKDRGISHNHLADAAAGKNDQGPKISHIKRYHANDDVRKGEFPEQLWEYLQSSYPNITKKILENTGLLEGQFPTAQLSSQLMGFYGVDGNLFNRTSEAICGNFLTFRRWWKEHPHIEDPVAITNLSIHEVKHSSLGKYLCAEETVPYSVEGESYKKAISRGYVIPFLTSVHIYLYEYRTWVTKHFCFHRSDTNFTMPAESMDGHLFIGDANDGNTDKNLFRVHARRTNKNVDNYNCEVVDFSCLGKIERSALSLNLV